MSASPLVVSALGLDPHGARLRVDEAADRESVDLREVLVGQYLDGRAGGVDPALVQQHDLVRHGGGMVQVVQDDPECRPVVVREIADQIEGLDLVAQVEMVGRLVEQQDAGVLGETGRQPDPLELAAGELVDRPRPPSRSRR